MAKWLCLCGETIRISGPIPHPYEWLVISDVVFEEAYESPIKASDLYGRMSHIWRCPKCDRIWAFWDGVASDPTVYEPKYVRWREENEEQPEIEAFINLARQALESDNSKEQTIEKLRQAGASKNDSIRAIEVTLRMLSGEARTMIERSETWSDQLSDTEKRRYEFFDEVKDKSI